MSRFGSVPLATAPPAGCSAFGRAETSSGAETKNHTAPMRDARGDSVVGPDFFVAFFSGTRAKLS